MIIAPYSPIFNLSVESVNVISEIRVNDIPVLRLPGGVMRMEFDVNPYVMTGTNTLTLIVRPNHHGEFFGDQASARVSLRRKFTPQDESFDTLATLDFNGPRGDVAHGFEQSPGYVTTNAPVIERLGLRATQSFELQTPFPAWCFANTPKFERTESLRAELLDTYRYVHSLLVARDIQALESACVMQARDYQAAYGLPDLQAAYKVLSIAQFISDPDIVIEDFPASILDVELLAQGRLVQLVDAEGKSPLRLSVHSAPELSGRFNVVFTRTMRGLAIAR